MKAQELRTAFLEFFKGKNHPIFPSDSLVPKDDPTLLFTSAGMNQFKPYFLGIKKDVRRAASIQKCLRTGDLENVGKTASHHTFFEMLGNFSFGDYFKKEAIAYAWEFLTGVLNIPKSALWISVYKDDTEAFCLWKDQVGIPAGKIMKLGAADNFWPANVITDGPDGPCGPCSEIYFDRGPRENCPDSRCCAPGCSCKRFVEVWNLVFTQYNRIGGKLEELPSKNIDTGMGLERLCSVLQGTDTNFKTDVFRPILAGIKERLAQKEDSPAAYVIADHIRSIFFAVSDGVLPSNEGRGYVIRKLIRRAFWTGHVLSEVGKPFLYALVPSIKESMGMFYKENFAHTEDVEKIIFSEEEKFLFTMEVGKKMLFGNIEEAKRSNKKVLAGETVFKLYDACGFPVEFTEKIAQEADLTIDKEGFQRLMSRQKETSKKSSKFEESIFAKTVATPNMASTFVGYGQDTYESTLIGIVQGERLVESLHENQSGAVILKESVFYPESGGQLYDTGKIIKGSNLFTVENVLRLNNCIACVGRVEEGSFARNDRVSCTVDMKRRATLKRAHTATHLLQAALRKCLGTHVKQQGSLVDEDALRFDFNHFSRVSPEELQAIERGVNAFIFSADPVCKHETSLQEAQEKKALAFFQEKYEARVRVVSAGAYSAELCGGLHVENTVEVGIFKIVSEGSVASGIRRIEAVCGKLAYEAFSDDTKTLDEIVSVLKSSRKDIADAVLKQAARLKGLEKAVQTKDKALLETKIEEILHGKNYAIGRIFLLVHKVEGDQEVLPLYADILSRKNEGHPHVVLLLSRKQGETQAPYICSMNRAAQEAGLSCGALMDRIFATYQGKGSRKPELSRGVITAPSPNEEGLKRIAEEYISESSKE